ncbi:H(+)-transporting V1 sector ATPase subunit H [Dimargaris cristalligena]|nr:H(+)-transporting V1 sector ATPase subunit H [Dimargaris cristalligena]
MPAVGYAEPTAEKYIDLFLILINKLSRMDALQYILVAFDDTIQKFPDTLVYLCQLEVKSEGSPFNTLKRCLGKDDDYLNLKAAKIITDLLNHASPKFVQTFDFTDLLLWLNRQLQSENPNVVDVSVQILQGLLKLRSFRPVFYGKAHLMNIFMGLIQASREGNPQMLYQLLFCLWLLSFEPIISDSLDKQYGVISQLVAIAKGASKEKLTRIVMATLKNLLVTAPGDNLAAMVAVKLLNFCDNLATRKWTDEDILDDIEFIRQELTERFQKLSTWDEYVSEVESGHLSWTPSHQSDAFWKMHASQLAADRGRLLNCLAHALNVPNQDPTVLAVAAHDIGQFVKYYPLGKKMVQDSGAKQKIMELLTHPNADVKYRALVALQVLMSHAWDQ